MAKAKRVRDTVLVVGKHEALNLYPVLTKNKIKKSVTK
jgi:hypothetical protein